MLGVHNITKLRQQTTQTSVHGGYKKCHLKQFLTQENITKKTGNKKMALT